jgi:molybdenum transport protein
MFFTMAEIDQFIKEDVPYMDLTAKILGIGAQQAKISYFTREQAVVCGTEEVGMIFERLNIKIESFMPSGSFIGPGKELVSGVGRADDIMTAWKVGQNILDNCCGIATKTHAMVTAAKAVNPDISILTTRKIFPGTKALAIKAAVTGGALPHRLGLSETVLIFRQHMDFIDSIGGFEALLAKLPQLKAQSCGKKILVETSSFAEAEMLCNAGVCGIQFDKVKAQELKRVALRLKADFPHVTLLASGGINQGNVAEYASSGIDGIVTSSPYNAPPIDIGVKICAINTA